MLILFTISEGLRSEDARQPRFGPGGEFIFFCPLRTGEVLQMRKFKTGIFKKTQNFSKTSARTRNFGSVNCRTFCELCESIFCSIVRTLFVDRPFLF